MSVDLITGSVSLRVRDQKLSNRSLCFFVPLLLEEERHVCRYGLKSTHVYTDGGPTVTPLYLHVQHRPYESRRDMNTGQKRRRSTTPEGTRTGRPLRHSKGCRTVKEKTNLTDLSQK